MRPLERPSWLTAEAWMLAMGWGPREDAAAGARITAAQTMLLQGLSVSMHLPPPMQHLPVSELV